MQGRRSVSILGEGRTPRTLFAMASIFAAGLLVARRNSRFDAERYVEGHSDSVFSRPELESLAEKMRLAEKAVREGSAIAAPDEDTEYFVQAFRQGARD